MGQDVKVAEIIDHPSKKRPMAFQVRQVRSHGQVAMRTVQRSDDLVQRSRVEVDRADPRARGGEGGSHSAPDVARRASDDDPLVRQPRTHAPTHA